ncbi:unnamed protein product, partial [Allacma fusca]
MLEVVPDPAAELKKVKIQKEGMYGKSSSMKRDRDRDGSPPTNKRSRSSLGRYDQDSSDGGTPPDRRRRPDHSPPPPPRRGGGGGGGG